MRTAVMVMGACVALIGVSLVAGANAAAERVQTRIPPEALGPALEQLAETRDMQVLYFSATVKDLRTSGATGDLTADEALIRLLSGTGLAYRYIAQNAVTVFSAKTADAEAAPGAPGAAAVTQPASSRDQTAKEGKSSSSQQFRLAEMAQGAVANADPVTSPSQPSDNGISQLQEVIVTAQKFSQRAFDVPIDLQVVTGAELQQQGITSLSELQYAVPGLHVEGGSVYHYIVLRGVSNGAGNGALVGEYIDDADISADGYAGQVGYGTGDLQLFDLDRVEVLKGPQGTLYGDGAMGGVIRYITNKPALTRYGMSADVSTLFTQYGSPSQHVETTLNAPLIAGTFGVRIAGQFQHDGGWVNEPAANLKNINDDNLTDVRIEALWQPIADFRALATEVIHREAYGIGEGEDARGNFTPVYGVTLVPNGEQDFNLSNLTLTADFAGVQLLSSSTYLTHTEVDNNQSYNFPPEVELESYFPVSNDSFNEELRLHNTNHGSWHWTLGGFYKHFRDDTGGVVYTGLPGALSSASLFYIPYGPADVSRSEAVFADTNLKLGGRLTLGAGIRYYRDRVDVASQGFFENGILLAPAQSIGDRNTSTDPRFYVQYSLTSHVNAYASAAKGFRSGEPNLGEFKGFDPESLWSYDLGTKMRFLQGHLRSDADVFYENYSNYVGEGAVTVYGFTEFGTFNIGAARIKGVDADIAWVGRRWRISASGELVDSKFATITAGDTGLLPGERVPDVPPYMFVGSVERDFTWGDKPGFAVVTYSQTGRVVGYTSPVIQSDVIQLLSFRTGIRWSPNLNLAFFVQNLLNDRGYLDSNWDQGAAWRPRPRTFGMDFAVSLE